MKIIDLDSDGPPISRFSNLRRSKTLEVEMMKITENLNSTSNLNLLNYTDTNNHNPNFDTL